MIKSNYHTHTKRCGHALDEDIDYVEGAIEAGITDLGFSDHVPLRGLSFPGTRPDYDTINDYVSSVTALGQRYKAEITLHIGYEAEYLPERLADYDDMMRRGIQYFICGQHCRIEGGRQVWYNASRHDESAVTAYVDDVVAAIDSGLYLYIAHPDHFMNGYRVWDGFSERQARRLIEAAVKADMPLEINVAGIRFAEYKHRKNCNGDPIENMYPYPAFWDLVREYGAKSVIGIDAHRKYDLLDGVGKEAEDFAALHGLTPLHKLEIK